MHFKDPCLPSVYSSCTFNYEDETPEQAIRRLNYAVNDHMQTIGQLKIENNCLRRSLAVKLEPTDQFSKEEHEPCEPLLCIMLCNTVYAVICVVQSVYFMFL